MESLPHQLLYSGRKSPHFLACALWATTHRTPGWLASPFDLRQSWSPENGCRLGFRESPGLCCAPLPLPFASFFLFLPASSLLLGDCMSVRSVDRSSQTDRIGDEPIPLSGLQLVTMGVLCVPTDVHRQLGTFEHLSPPNPLSCTTAPNPPLLRLSRSTASLPPGSISKARLHNTAGISLTEESMVK